MLKVGNFAAFFKFDYGIEVLFETIPQIQRNPVRTTEPKRSRYVEKSSLDRMAQPSQV